ncbi:2-octaprenyl-6-methoxyphenyl hydroxylase [Candidatus Erwinia haradaeae]|uniref:2-octaprenyl-6-methoxyphenol hydroxylase n=1 Tax=Candidatus Erwinia haradaeae TaxID=1922217 RepID=A0A451DAQ6_9GAMM|nr:2-octaprenyl-6-methoxyphenyl hydroxylase [Candidatus Erwinia haradaeae]VFP83390.1 2-octaprenyl-6-methoxyphenol hydroxylase [Candidatus Erwinia haradaeae]
MSIIIVGGGIVGSMLALALSYTTQGNQTIFLIAEKKLKSNWHTTYDGKSIALSIDTCQKIASFGVWSAIKPLATAITNIHISDRGSPGFILLNSQDYNISALGYIIELSRAMNTLLTCVQEAPGIHLYCPRKVSEIERFEEYVCVTLDNGEKIHGELLVAADGTYSDVANLCGIKRCTVNYEQVAVVSTVLTQLAHNGWAFERFTDQGPLAMLPIANGYSTFIWCQSYISQQRIEKWNDKQFLIELQDAFGWRLGRFLQVGRRKIHPLQLQTTTQNISHRLVLIGNAAQTLHPIAGQGFNLGMRDITLLADTLQSAWKHGTGAGDYLTLQNYQKSRMKDVRDTITITDGLLRIFSNRHAGLVMGRALALIMIDQIPSLRRVLAQWILGGMQWNTALRDKNETL